MVIIRQPFRKQLQTLTRLQQSLLYSCGWEVIAGAVLIKTNCSVTCYTVLEENKAWQHLYLQLDCEEWRVLHWHRCDMFHTPTASYKSVHLLHACTPTIATKAQTQWYRYATYLAKLNYAAD